MSLIGDIETAIQERLRAASTQDVLGYKLRQVESLPQDLEENLADHVQSFPAMWTVYAGWRKVSDQADGGIVADLSFSVICAASNLRNGSAARHGAGAEPGSIQMVMDVVGLVAGRDFGLPIGPMIPGDQKPLITGQTKGHKLSLFAQAFTARAAIDLVDEPDILLTQPQGDFAEFGVAWDLPPSDPDAPDLETVQTLET